ncbi:DUF6266 family protein, partial [Daejeonella sp.]|uniref:DUF6266 family protein n=1 Tax=Daejeonella sp. TaxID=2805397 RepID=UPI0030C4F19E
TIRKGALGGFSGKAGSIIGSSWRDINYIKGLPKLSNKPKTEKQLDQQAKFALAVKFLQPVKSLMNIGFGQVKTGKATGFNMALKQLLDTSITGIYPDYEVDLPNVSFSKGSLGVPTDIVIVPDALSLQVFWSTRFDKLNRFVSDEMNILVHEPVSGDFVIGPDDLLRTTGQGNVDIPSEWLGRTVHIYMFYVSGDAKAVSNSVYAGTADII